MKRPIGARKTLLIEANSHAVKKLEIESAAGVWAPVSALADP